MESNIIEARTKDILAIDTQSIVEKNVPEDEMMDLLNTHFEEIKDIFDLAGGRLNKVFRANHKDEDKVFKISNGQYRVAELKREANILKYLSNHEFVPYIEEFIESENVSLIVEEYLEGDSLRQKLKECNDENIRSFYWRKAGKTLSEIHRNLIDSNDRNSWLDGQLLLAKKNLDHDFIDVEDFQGENPRDVFEWLLGNRPSHNYTTLLHGDFRTKNILITNNENLKIIDWGFVDLGDPYYDLAIIDYYFCSESDRKSFYQGYARLKYDPTRLNYYEKLSWFINI